MNTRGAVVALQHWPELSDVDRVLERCLADLGGVERFVKPGQTVVLKPNLTANAPSHSGGTTHVELVEAIVRLVQPCRPGRILVAEGTGAFGTEHETAFPTGGWREMAARTGAELFNLDAGPHQEITLEEPRYPHPLPFSQLLLEAEVFITVPCLKTHLGCDYTVALKNAYGQTPQWKRSEIHAQGLLEEALVDLNRIRPPDLTVVDGYDGAEGIAGGMAFDRPAGARVMIAGADPVAVDAVSREIMGLTFPTRYLDWAAEEGLGAGDLSQIEIVGAALEECRHPFLSPAEELCALAPELAIQDQRACSGCRSAALMALSRLRHQKLRKPLTVIYGGESDRYRVAGDGWRVAGVEREVLRPASLIVGRCASRHAAPYPPEVTLVEGCPARTEDVVQALQSMEVVCHQCLDLANRVLAEFPDPFKEHLRVTASGSRVFTGSQVRRHEWHLELLVGRCMGRYAQVIQERGPQFGLDPERDVVFLNDCPVEEQAVRAALQRLEATCTRTFPAP